MRQVNGPGKATYLSLR